MTTALIPILLFSFSLSCSCLSAHTWRGFVSLNNISQGSGCEVNIVMLRGSKIIAYIGVSRELVLPGSLNPLACCSRSPLEINKNN